MGRIFRLVAGIGFLVVGYVYRTYTLSVLSMAWGVLPLSAGVLDICYNTLRWVVHYLAQRTTESKGLTK